MGLRPAYQEIIDKAIKAIQDRGFYAQYPEHPKAYGEEAPVAGLEAFKAQMGKPFNGLMQGDEKGRIGEEESPYTQEALGIDYPNFDAKDLIARAGMAGAEWSKTSVADRTDILVDSLERAKERFFEIAYATMHTTGQSFMMAFQASGPHANDRALEALAMAHQELTRFPEHVVWDKPMGKFNVVLDKKWKPVPKGIALVIGCSTFPTWNSVPGLYASLACGNPTIVKPHPRAILPIAIFVQEIQQALAAKGLNPEIVQLAVDSSDAPITKQLAENDKVTLIDYTGGSAFGDYIEGLKGKEVFTEKAGVNSVILDSTADLKATLGNIAFAASLYSGQMCTAPQNIFIPSTGVNTPEGNIAYADVVEHLKNSVHGLVTHPKMGAGTLGAIQNPTTVTRAQSMGSLGSSVLETTVVENPEFANARICAPTIREVQAADTKDFEKELFGPILLVIKTDSTDQSIELARDMAIKHGAITCSAYCTDDAVCDQIEAEMEKAFTPVSFNFAGAIFVNQHAAFSDFHVTGGNPAGNASFTNPDYVNRRFVWVGHRKMKA